MSSLRPLHGLTQPLKRALRTHSTSAPALACTPSSHRVLQPLAFTTSSSFSTSTKRAAASHDDHYDPPGGWLWGIPPGEKYEKEGWEGFFWWVFVGGIVIASVGAAFKPDTSIQTWALEEARRRLEAEGILPDPDLVDESAKSE